MQPFENITAMDLVRTTLRQAVRYSGRILPIMGLVWLLQIPTFLSEDILLPLDAMEIMGLPPGPISIVAATVVMLATYIGSTWAAVGWHRLVLLGEEPGQFLPKWHRRPILDYFIVSLFLPILAWGLPALGVFAVYLIVLVKAAPTALVAIPGLPATVIAVWLSLRLSPVQVSRALQDRVSIRDAFARTAALARPLWGCAIIGTLALCVLFGGSFLFTTLMTGPGGYYHSDTVMYLDAIVSWAAYFLFFVISASAYNTLYLLAGTDHADHEVEAFT